MFGNDFVQNIKHKMEGYKMQNSNTYPVCKFMIANEQVVYMDYGYKIDNMPLFMRVYDYVPNRVFLENKQREKINMNTVKIISNDKYGAVLTMYIPNQCYIAVSIHNCEADFIADILKNGVYVLSLYDFLQRKVTDDNR